jgi:hypothetical protein
MEESTRDVGELRQHQFVDMYRATLRGDRDFISYGLQHSFPYVIRTDQSIHLDSLLKDRTQDRRNHLDLFPASTKIQSASTVDSFTVYPTYLSIFSAAVQCGSTEEETIDLFTWLLQQITLRTNHVLMYVDANIYSFAVALGKWALLEWLDVHGYVSLEEIGSNVVEYALMFGHKEYISLFARGHVRTHANAGVYVAWGGHVSLASFIPPFELEDPKMLSSMVTASMIRKHSVMSEILREHYRTLSEEKKVTFLQNVTLRVVSDDVEIKKFYQNEMDVRKKVIVLPRKDLSACHLPESW